MNINNTITNSYIINQETNQYTGEETFTKKVNMGNSTYQVLSNTYQELSFKLMNNSSDLQIKLYQSQLKLRLFQGLVHQYR